MKLGLVGKGIVGEALYKSFKHKGKNLYVYDKYKRIGDINFLLSLDLIFACLPTPILDNKGYDLSSLEEICAFLSKHNWGGTLVIKSTISPGTTDRLKDLYNLRIIHNPEFLTARSALEDFNNQKQIILGGTHYKEVEELYRELYPEAKVSICSAKEAESMKLFLNNFYAMKVQIFTEFYLLCQETEVDYQAIKDMMLSNGWINPMHTIIPGPDGQISYGGMCFPKDTQALLHFMKSMGVPSAMLEACIKERNKMRE